jgi:hypothetical protein
MAIRPEYERILQRPPASGGPCWELDLYVSVPHAIPALRALASAPRLRGWWARDEGDRLTERPVDAFTIQDILGDETREGIQLVGIALGSGQPGFRCSLSAIPLYANDHIGHRAAERLPRGSLCSVWLMLFVAPGDIEALYPGQDIWCSAWTREPESLHVPWVEDLAGLFYDVATHVCAQCPVLCAWFGMEGGPAGPDQLSAEALLSPYNAVFIPQSHPLAATPNARRLDIGQGYAFFGLGRECSIPHRD